MLPDFFVIGAQKAGSTFLLQCLGEHPQIFMPESEVPFFEDSLYLVDEGKIKIYISDAEGREMQQRIPLGRTGQLHEISGPLLLLASDASSYMNGSVIAVDGGHLCRTL